MQCDVSPKTNHIEFYQTRDTILSSQDLKKLTIPCSRVHTCDYGSALLFVVHAFYHDKCMETFNLYISNPIRSLPPITSNLVTVYLQLIRH